MKTETQRLILFLVFALSAFMLYERWQAHYHPAPAAAASSSAAPGAVPAKAPTDVPGTQGAAPRADVPGATAAATPGAVPGAAAAPAGGERVTIKTDLLTAQLDTLGGVITQVALSQHKTENDSAEPYLALQKNAERTFVAQPGLLRGLPNHYTQYTLLPGPRELAPGQDTLPVQLAATAANGDKVVLTYTFHRGSYVIDTDFAVTNNGTAPVSPSAYFQFTRDGKHAVAQSTMGPSSYVGAVVSTDDDKYVKVDFSELDKEAADAERKKTYVARNSGGWVSMVEHYFVSAWLPPADAKAHEFYTRKLDGGLYSAGVVVDGAAIAPGATANIRVPLYVGPQDQDVLSTLAPNLQLVVDYGKLSVIATPLFALLKWLHGYIGNWGWSIIVMTIMIKGVFYPLNAASARSMAKMKIVAPKMKSLQETYANDKAELQKKMMEMYKTEKINPLGGCLPILVQIPVFIALYWVLLSAVELRHAPWIGWIKDLSAPDPWYVLPVLYAITAWLQVKLSPTPVTDPMQAKMFQIMPIAFSVMFIFFPSGLVLYWLVNNLLQIAQQWHVNRMLTKEAAVKAEKRR